MKRFGVPLIAGLTLFIFVFANTVALRLLLLAILLVMAIVHYARERPPLPSFIWIFFGLCLFALSSMWWSVDPAMTLKEVKNEFIYTFLAFFSFYVLAKRDDVLVAGLTGFALAAITMVGLVLGGYIAENMWLYRNYQGGVGNYSTFVIAAVPILMYLIWRVGGVWQRAILVLVLVGLLVAGFWTLNRALWPALLVESLVAAALLASRLPKKYVLGGAAVALVVGGFVWVKSVEVRTGGLQIEEMVLSDPRMPLWDVAEDAIDERPLLGVGFGRGAFGKAYGDRPGSRGDHAHNLFLNRAVQLGLVGLALTVALLGSVGNALWRTFRSHPGEAVSWLAAAGLVYLVGLLAKNMTDDFFIREVSLLFWAIMGLILGAARRRSAVEATPNP